tara:strand:+ start:1290 stop:1781 length:492 start_codon:yes stop_codon:yes gene_type:complete
MMLDKFPDRVLFACTLNSARSPMAEGIMKKLYGDQVFVDSVGARKGEIAGFSIAAMAEIGIDISSHRAKSFEELDSTPFDMVVSLSPEAQHKAVELTRSSDCNLLFWHTFDATAVSGNRDTILSAFREVRDFLLHQILSRFAPTIPPRIPNHPVWKTIISNKS